MAGRIESMARLFLALPNPARYEARNAHSGPPMTAPSRKSVGIYERPHPLRTRKVLIPVLVAVAVAVVYGSWAYFT
jgi:hypothetical protein